MFPILLAFLVWLLATGKYDKWAALVDLQPLQGGATGSW